VSRKWEAAEPELTDDRFRDVFGGPLDGDRIAKEYPAHLEVCVAEVMDAGIIGATGLGGLSGNRIPILRCTMFAPGKRTRKKPLGPVHVYEICEEGHYHHQGCA
jgi:hypothetical protein